MVLDFKKIIAWLKRNKIVYTIKDNKVVLFNDSNGSVELVFNYDRSTPKAPRGCLIPTSAAEGSEFYVKVGDWGKWINEFLVWAKDRGYYEYNHYNCAQWGTWKFGNFISMSFFGVFIKKILALKNGVNESMQLDEAKKILADNGYILNEKFVNIDEIRVPEWLWVAYETGDISNLEDEEIVILHIFEKDHKNHILEANAEPNFYPTNDVTDEGGMCYTVQVFEDRLVEGYNFYRNRFYQMNRKHQEQRELIKNELIEKIMAAAVGYDEEELKSKDIRELKKILNNL